MPSKRRESLTRRFSLSVQKKKFSTEFLFKEEIENYISCFFKRTVIIECDEDKGLNSAPTNGVIYWQVLATPSVTSYRHQ